MIDEYTEWAIKAYSMFFLFIFTLVIFDVVGL